jgi:hypothetical protein
LLLDHPSTFPTTSAIRAKEQIMPLTPPRRVRFGVTVQPQRTTWSDFAPAVQAVESLGFDTLWNFDHLLPWCGDPGDPCFETWTTLTAMAMLTTRIRIGTLVNGVIYRDPATLAKSATMVDIISGDRAVDSPQPGHRSQSGGGAGPVGDDRPGAGPACR